MAAKKLPSLSDKDKADIRKMIRQCCEGDPQEWKEELYRLFTLTLKPEEEKWWRAFGVLRGGRIHMSEDEMKAPTVTFALWHLSRMGILKRVQEP